MDNTYLSRIEMRKSIMHEHREVILAAEMVSKPAVDEFYAWIMGMYLPTRFPRMFEIVDSKATCHIDKTSESMLRNLVTGDVLPVHPPEYPSEALERLSGFVDEDFLFLLPADDGDGYVLKAFVSCYPSGFNPSKLLNKKLREIHAPVPGYRQKLEKSMDRYFDRLEVGKIVKRANVGSYGWLMT